MSELTAMFEPAFTEWYDKTFPIELWDMYNVNNFGTTAGEERRLVHQMTVYQGWVAAKAYYSRFLPSEYKPTKPRFRPDSPGDYLAKFAEASHKSWTEFESKNELPYGLINELCLEMRTVDINVAELLGAKTIIPKEEWLRFQRELDEWDNGFL